VVGGICWYLAGLQLEAVESSLNWFGKSRFGNTIRTPITCKAYNTITLHVK
jgi:hypothetical protein